MNRRRFLERSAVTAGTGVALAGCTAEQETEGLDNPDENNEPVDGDEKEEPEPDPKPEGGDGRPYTHYDLDVHDEREAGQPVWIDQNERIYGRDDLAVTISDDWGETTEVLYSFEGHEQGRVETVIVPDSGTVICHRWAR